MKAKFMLIAMALGLLLSLNVQAGPNGSSDGFAKMSTDFKERDSGGDNGRGRGRGRSGDDRRSTKAPEISADSAAISLALISGVLLLAAERSRARRA